MNEDIEKQVLDFLKENNIQYSQYSHSPMVSMDQYEDLQKKIGCRIPKNLFLSNRQKTRFYLLSMPGDKKFLTKELSSQINSARLSFASEESLKEYLCCYKGSTSVFGLLFDKEKKVNLLLDEDILKEEYLGFHPCQNTSTIKIRTKDVIDNFLKDINRDYQVVKLICEQEDDN